MMIVLSLCLVDHVQQCDHLFVAEGAGLFAFLWFIACVLSNMACLLFILESLVGYVLRLWLFLDIYTGHIITKTCLFN